MKPVMYIPLLHRTAQLTAVGTLLLIFMGGLVTSHQAGMSVPDWPNSYGYNMFTFPPSKWIGGIFYEHTHRLMGTVVGFCSIVLVTAAYLRERRRWVRSLSYLVLGLVVVQGILGGLRVRLVMLDLAIIHACLAQICFAMTVLVSVITSQWWMAQRNLIEHPTGHRLIVVASASVVAIFLQLVVGALMRHYQAGLAIPDLPLHYGKILPPMDQVALNAANAQRVDLQLPPTTLGGVWLHFGHRMGAVLVTVLLSTAIVMILRKHREQALQNPALILIGLLLTQLTLGILTVLWRKPADIASLHVAIGAFTLVTTLVLLARSMRLYSPRWRAAPAGFESEYSPDQPVAIA